MAEPSPAPPLRRSAQDIEAERRLFWRNLVQQTLTSLPLVASSKPELLDGRVAILTRGGERIPIRAVHPLLACSVNTAGDPAARALSLSVQCTVFRVETPSGEAFTLPLHEIRAIHTLSDELMRELQQQAEKAADQAAQQEGAVPFGFAAFTSLARQRRDEQAPPADLPP